jgi:hypothetical protein
MPRKSIGEQPMTDAERQARCRSSHLLKVNAPNQMSPPAVARSCSGHIGIGGRQHGRRTPVTWPCVDASRRPP